MIDIAHLIQSSVAPVFLLSGVAATLGVLTNRLSRIVDRARVLEDQLAGHPGEGPHLHGDLAVLARRANYINVAISLSTIAALLVALVVVTTVRSRWRWLAWAYPALTTLAVVVTANHFWLDGIAAAVLLVLVIGVQRAAGPAYRGMVARRSRPAPDAAAVADAPAIEVPAVAEVPEMVPAGAAAAARAVSAAARARPEPGQSPGGAQPAAGAHARAHRSPRPCPVNIPARDRPGHRPGAGHAVPSREQDGR